MHSLLVYPYLGRIRVEIATFNSSDNIVAASSSHLDLATAKRLRAELDTAIVTLEKEGLG